MSGILESVELEIACEECGDPLCIPASVVRESQEMLQCSCPGSPWECPAGYFASLVEPGALADLEDAWRRVHHSAQSAAANARMRALATASRPPGLAAIDRDAAAVRSWESEGGAIH